MANNYLLILGATWRENALPQAHFGSHLVGYPHTAGWGHTAVPPADGGALTWERVTFQEQNSAV